MTRHKKSRGGGRKLRHMIDPTDDIDMADVVLPRKERYNRKQNKRSGFQTQQENDWRGRVNKAVKVNSSSPQFRNRKLDNADEGFGSRTRRLRSSLPRTPINHFPDSSGSGTHRSSIASAISSASSARSGPWCGKCARLNRQLRQYLLNLLDNGIQALDEWSYAAGVSPDHMDCEPAPMMVIPEGFRRCSQQCQNCVAVRNNAPATAPAQAPTPPQSSEWSGSTLADSGLHNVSWAAPAGVPLAPEQPRLHARWASPGNQTHPQDHSQPSQQQQKQQQPNSVLDEAQAVHAIQDRNPLIALPQHWGGQGLGVAACEAPVHTLAAGVEGRRSDSSGDGQAPLGVAPKVVGMGDSYEPVRSVEQLQQDYRARWSQQYPPTSLFTIPETQYRTQQSAGTESLRARVEDGVDEVSSRRC